MPQPFQRRTGRLKPAKPVVDAALKSAEALDLASADPQRAGVSGIFQLNVRVPADILARVRGTRLHLPLDDAFVAVKASDKVFLSLRTRDPVVGKRRHAAALSRVA